MGQRKYSYLKGQIKATEEGGSDEATPLGMIHVKAIQVGEVMGRGRREGRRIARRFTKNKLKTRIRLSKELMVKNSYDVGLAEMPIDMDGS